MPPGFVVTLHHVRPAEACRHSIRTRCFRSRRTSSTASSPTSSQHGWRSSASTSCAGAASAHEPRRIAVTLDDGYRNNLEHALPVFRRHAVPFTIYVCPGFSDRTSELWWEALERIIAGAESISLAGEGPAERCRRVTRREE